MTALAGIYITSGDCDARRRCERMLRAQAIYANRPARIESAACGALGAALHATLPEDRWSGGVHVGDDGRFVLAADVRLDDRAEWVARLGVAPDEALRLSDAALLARAWAVHGCAVIARIHGDFALAVLDTARGELVLARDFLGQRPLFYHAGEGFVAVASMPVGLHALPEVPPRPDARALARYLSLDPEIDETSFFAGIATVRPGEIVRIGIEGARRQRYWHPPRPSREERDPEQIDTDARALFDRAVAVRLRRVGALGCHLSGGLDSCAVMASAADQLEPGECLTAFTAVPPDDAVFHDPLGRFVDEGGHAAAAAARYANVDHVRVVAERDDPVATWDRTDVLFQVPLPNPCNFAWHAQINDRARQRGIGVLLTGYLGNLSLSFDPAGHHANLLAAGSLRQLWREWRGWRRHGRSWFSLLAGTIAPLLPGLVLRPLLRLAGRAADPAAASFVAPDAQSRPGRTIFDAARAIRERDNWQARRRALGWVDFGVLNKGILGGWGIDLRDPTADRALIEFCLGLPDAAFRRAGETRALARSVFRNRLPPLVLDEVRRGYQAADWRRNLIEARGALTDELERSAGLPLAEALLDRRGLNEALASLDGDASPGRADELRLRRGALRGLAAAHFIRKASGSNR